MYNLNIVVLVDLLCPHFPLLTPLELGAAHALRMHLATLCGGAHSYSTVVKLMAVASPLLSSSKSTPTRLPSPPADLGSRTALSE